jgi:excisionase family DNA binding protein
MGNLGPLLEVKSAAARLGWKEAVVRKKLERRLLPFVKLGGRIYIPERALEQYLGSLPGLTVEEALAHRAGA